MPRPIRRRGSGCIARPSSGLLPSPTSARLGPLGTSRFYTSDAADFALCCGLRTCSLLGFDAPLRHRTLPRCREPATGPSGGYPDRTFTGWPDDASSGHTRSCGNSFQLLTEFGSRLHCPAIGRRWMKLRLLSSVRRITASKPRGQPRLAPPRWPGSRCAEICPRRSARAR